MNRNLQALPPFFRDVFVEVPGWPDAPLGQKLRRLLPLLLPVLVLVGLAVWHFAVEQPARERSRQGMAALLELENEVSQLALRCSEAESQRLRLEADQADRLLFHTDAEKAAVLSQWESLAAAADWRLQVTPGEVRAESGHEAFRRQAFRAQLQPGAANRRPLATLVPLLEQFSQGPKRIDLIRLSIRADDHGWQGVELGFHAALPLSYEKVAK